jgi:hypothetical protein
MRRALMKKKRERARKPHDVRGFCKKGGVWIAYVVQQRDQSVCVQVHCNTVVRNEAGLAMPSHEERAVKRAT